MRSQKSKIINDGSASPSQWYLSGWNARLDFQDGEPPLTYSHAAKQDWRAGYRDCEAYHFSDDERPE